MGHHTLFAPNQLVGGMRKICPVAAALALGCANPPDTSCKISATKIRCDHETASLPDGVGQRDVHWRLPSGFGQGPAPEGGWPVAIFFQGSLFPADGLWSAVRGTPLGAWHQADVTRHLLDAGYAVIAPETMGEGLTAWNTNLPGWASRWEESPDAALMEEIFAAVEAGEIGDGEMSMEAWHALGISSGGYMTSRMAVSQPGRFASLVVVSASYATCAGAVCKIPDALPDDHPPTRFLHGAIDPVVPIYTMRKYRDRLDDLGFVTDEVTADLVGHAWFKEAPEAVVGWFDRHPADTGGDTDR